MTRKQHLEAQSSGRRMRRMVPLVTLLTLCGCRPAPTWPSVQARITSRFPAVSQMPIQELARRLESRESILLIDTREREEYQVSHIRGAQLSTSTAEIRELVAAQGQERDVVLYCSVGYRSSAAAADLIDQGYTRVFNLKGSIFAWANAGLRVYQGEKIVETVHPFSDDWAHLLNDQ